ncbi:MAG: alpha/beta hydrolase [Ottowia sp.]|uniref:esterase/lipase family protein n=1 Tax=Ottowia sp. TaxID=1898956 RepID=UPI0039E2C8FE
MERGRLATRRPAPPSRLLMLGEGRAFWEAGATLAMWPWLTRAPRGDGHPVLVLPGLLASDTSTRPLRNYLKKQGYEPHGWNLGRNLGPRAGIESGMVRRLHELSERHGGRKVSLVGWSLGGVYARLLTKHYPQLVRSVITLGSPLRGHIYCTNAWQVYELVSGQASDDPQRMSHATDVPQVPTTSIYSRSDGVVAWRSSLTRTGPRSENIEVRASHLGLGVHPAVLYAVADRLSQPEGEWKPFDRRLFGPLAYPKPGER